MLKELTRESLSQQINTPFRVEGDAGAVILDLIVVSAMRPTANTESFSIVFRGPLDAFLPQAIYHFQHDLLGDFELFIVPIGKDNHGFLYESIFNHLRREA